MQGDLATINLAELLVELYLSKSSGILRLSQGEVKKGIYFKDGSIVFAHSNLKGDRLGETLLRLGKITEEEFEIASQEVIQRGKRLGRALWEKGFLTPVEVNAGVNYQIQQIIFSLFNWDSGEYEFVERERPVYEDIMVEVSTPELLLSGIRGITNTVILERAIGTDDQRIVEVNLGVRKLPRNEFDFGEESILGCIDEKITLKKLKLMADLSPLEFGRAMYSLMLCGIIRIRKKGPEDEQVSPVEAKKRARLTTRPMPSPEQIPRAVHRLKTLSEGEVRQMVDETAARLREVTDEEALGILPDSTEDEVDRAYRKLTDIFHPLYYSDDRYHDIKDKLKYICERLAEAHDRFMERVASQLPLSETTLEESATDSEPQIIRHVYMEVPPKAKTSPPEQIQRPQPKPVAREPEPPKVEAQKELTVSELEERIRREPGNVSLLRVLGRKLQSVGKAVEAEKILSRALELEPQNVETHFALAEFYQSQGLKMKGFRHLNIILQLEPENSRALKMMGAKKRKKAMYEISGDIQ